MSKRFITFLALSLLVIGVCGQASPGQSRCNLTEATSPAVRGVRLGMSTADLLALVPGSSKRKEMRDALETARAASSEVVYLSFDPSTDATGDRFAGVESVGAGIYRGRVADFTVVYGGATWRTIDEWVAKLAESFNLPGGQEWAEGPSENPNKVLRCGGIEIEAAIQGGSSSIKVRNTEPLKDAQERARTDEERRRRTFKP